MSQLEGADRTGAGQVVVDLGQHLFGLLLHGQGLVVGDGTRQKDQIAIDGGPAVPDARLHSLDIHDDGGSPRLVAH